MKNSESGVDRPSRISMDPAICHGKPVIAGTRVPVSQILAALAAGASRSEILEDYPSLKSDDIDVALCFASDVTRFEVVPEPGL